MKNKYNDLIKKAINKEAIKKAFADPKTKKELLKIINKVRY